MFFAPPARNNDVSSTQIKKLGILILSPRYYGGILKKSHAILSLGTEEAKLRIER